MASSKNTTVVVYGDSFASDTPRMAAAKARKLVQAVRYDKTEGQMVADGGFDGVDPSERLTEWVTNALGTPYHVSIDHNMCRRTYDMRVQCRSCHAFWEGDVADDALEYKPLVFHEFAAKAVAAVLAGRDVGVIDESKACFCVDKYTPSQCLMHWQDNQHTADLYGNKGAYAVLTSGQVDLARRMWSAALRTKQAAAREKERCQVVCDWQDEP